MRKKLFVALLLLFEVSISYAQKVELPMGTCGIVNVYDLAGNRIRRVYFCQNGTDPYPDPNRKQPVNNGEETENTSKNETPVAGKNETIEFQEVDALYPNPTTGKFFITFSKRLTNAIVSITDNTGKILTKFKANGYKTDFDLSPYAAGVYYVRIEEAGKVITKKVVKQ